MPMSEPLSDSALDQLFRTARTYNGYVDRPVGEDQLRAIWDLMKYGPTSANSLPARVVWCVSDAAKAKLAALAMPANGDKILKAPVTAIVAMDHQFFDHLPDLFPHADARSWRSEEHTSELQSLMRISYAVFCLKKKKKNKRIQMPT